MGVSTDAMLYYGVALEEGVAEEIFGNDDYPDFEEWWRKVNGFKPSKEVWTSEGERVDGVTEKEIELYFKERHDWENNNPCPVELQCHCCDNYSMFLITVKGVTVSRGDVHYVDDDYLKLDYGLYGNLCAFLEKFKIPHEKEPAWMLCSYWG